MKDRPPYLVGGNRTIYPFFHRLAEDKSLRSARRFPSDVRFPNDRSGIWTAMHLRKNFGLKVIAKELKKRGVVIQGSMANGDPSQQ